MSIVNMNVILMLLGLLVISGPAYAAPPLMPVDDITKLADPSRRPVQVPSQGQPVVQSVPAQTAAIQDIEWGNSGTLKNSTTVPKQVSEKTNQQAADTALKSGGLGIKKTEWEKIYGLPNRPCSSVGSITQCNYKSDLFIISFISQYPIRSISYGNGNLKSKLSQEESRIWVKSLIPNDSIFAKSYTSAIGQTVDIYNSKWLAGQFPANDNLYWINGKPGDFIIIYSGKSGISNITIGTGNNP